MSERMGTFFLGLHFALSLAVFLFVSAIVMGAMAVAATALAVSTPFLENNVLQLPEGKSTQFTIVLQNADETDIQANVGYSSDSNIAGVIDYKESYLLRTKSADTKLTFNITAPQNAQIGDVYEVRFTVSPAQAREGGTIAVLAGISRNFNVLIIRDPNKFYLNYYIAETGWLWGIVALTLVCYLAYAIFKRKKSKSRRAN